MSCLASFVYAKCIEVERRDLWEALISFGNNLSISWIIGGDFNMVLHANKRVGFTSNTLLGMEEFNSFVIIVSLQDCGYSGNKFTLSRKEYGLPRVCPFG